MDLAGLVKELAQFKSRIVVRPMRKYNTQRFVGDPHKLRGLLGTAAEVRPLEEGLKQYLAAISEREQLLIQD